MKNKIVLIIICFWGCLNSGKAQLLKDNETWVLKNIELYKYINNDSIKINTNDIELTNELGVFDTLKFVNGICRVKLFDNYMDAIYKEDNNNLSLYVSPIPFIFFIQKYMNKIILYRKFDNIDMDNVYGAKLIYLK